MPHPADPADSLAPVDPAAHATHDTLLVAAFAAGDATGAELETAVALVAGCPGCAALHGDLRLIAAALPAMPTPRRSRDFRLTAGQAASLRPAGWRRLLAPFAGPRFAFAAPLGSGLAALGLAGLLLAGTGLPLGGSSAGAIPAAAPAASAAPTAEDGFVSMAAASAAPAPEAQGPVTAPAGNTGAAATAGPAATAAPAPTAGPAGALAPAGGASTSANDKGTAAGADGSPGTVAGAAAATPPPASPASSPADAPGASREAMRATGVGDQTRGSPINPVLPALGAAMLVVGLALAGLRVLSRRVA